MPSSPSTARLHHLLPQLFQPNSQPGEQYLKLDITADISALVALNHVQESAQISSSAVTPLPNLPACVLGVMNARNQVLCVVDLAQILQIPERGLQRQHYSIITVRLNTDRRQTGTVNNLLALKLRGIQGIVRLQADDIISPVDEFNAQLTPFLRGCVVQAGYRLPVLDLDAIATAPALVSS